MKLVAVNDAPERSNTPRPERYALVATPHGQVCGWTNGALAQVMAHFGRRLPFSKHKFADSAASSLPAVGAPRRDGSQPPPTRGTSPRSAS